MKLREKGFKYLYPAEVYEKAKENGHSEEEPISRRSRRSPRKSAGGGSELPVPYGVVRDEDEREFHVGDIVRVESQSGMAHIALISDFVFGVDDALHVNLVWFTRPEELRKTFVLQENYEIYGSWDSDTNILDVLLDHARILSRNDFLEMFPDGLSEDDEDMIFFCRRAFDGTSNLYTKDEFDWNDLYEGRGTNVFNLVEKLQESVRNGGIGFDGKPPPQKKKRGRPPKRNRDEMEERGIETTRKKLKFSKAADEDDSDLALEDMEEIGSAKKKGRTADSDSEDEYEDGHEEEEDEEEDEEEEDVEDESDVEMLESDEEEEVYKKRGPGRPPGGGTPRKRGPGRPPGGGTPRRGPGRPPGGGTPRRGPGRPPGGGTPRKQNPSNFAQIVGEGRIRAPRTKNPVMHVQKGRIPRDGRMFVKSPLKTAALPLRKDSPVKENLASPPKSPHKHARNKLHVATVPESLPCRDDEFSQIFLALESAISSASGSCIYVSGTPGTGKTATVREAIAQLHLRCEEGELRDFGYLEVNGMKLVSPQDSYEILWEEVSGGQRVSASNAMVLLEQRFKEKDAKRRPIVVLMDELDQLVTKNQTVMYNFFNWPTLPNSRLIVVAVANTMDLPERMLSNKISSRLGLTRIQFPGYTHDQLKHIIESRLEDIAGGVVENDAIEFAARKIASVSGDARRALDICRRAVELAQPAEEVEEITAETRVKIPHVKQAINESINSPLNSYLRSLPMAAKVFLCSVLTRIRRSGVIDNPLSDILEETERLTRISPDSAKLTEALFTGKHVRMAGFQNALAELVESGVLVQQSMRGERSANVRLAAGEEEVKSALLVDEDVAGML
ncbi:hypothetical protein TRICI_006087 [Trichomonascus ciferrii]|uniref:Origin recognition complex subunit 1 n=1 Tax=Trichomonascus ciferrii TaxID=44093 RepID=A0A642ULK8_9ASCO|nr:hypothetical protein TRICI_006087 [Trichomonascus ciferrii]